MTGQWKNPTDEEMAALLAAWEQQQREPTPLPWSIERDTSSVSNPRVKLVGADGNTIADNEPYYPEAIRVADAEFIMLRVNAHDALVAALKPFANMPMPDQHGPERERILKARIAMALAANAA